jgi:hypothetical protein
VGPKVRLDDMEKYIRVPDHVAQSSVTIGKGKGHPRAGHVGPEGEQMYISTLSSTSALDGAVGCQHHASAALPPGKDPVPIV